MSVYIKEYRRTPFGRSKGGIYKNVDAIELSKRCLIAGVYDELVWGTVQQYGEQGYNIARQIGLTTEYLYNTPAITLNRLCGSSMSAVHYGYANIKAGMGNDYLVGGVEHMQHNPMTEHYYDCPELSRHMAKGSMNMGFTAELLAKQYKISRREQDELALESHKRAARLMFQDRLWVDTVGDLRIVTEDECFRKDASIEALSALKPSFDPRGTVTPGNSSAIADGAACMHLSSKEGKFEIIDTQVVTTTPALMGLGPVEAVKKILARNNLKVKDIEAWEINEAFAAQTIAVMKELGLKYEWVNDFGGAIAIGHPLGASGVRILGTLTRTMELGHKGPYGIATMCIGAGQGIATLIKRTDA